ncbi:MAG: tellurite resistance TerB family protein [Bacteroidota bacterium]|nr:tellurite resistance TerB family protein [Bacteroidota bacterium]
MGLFDFISKDKNINIANEKEAFYSIIYACAAVDGEIAPEEIEQLNNLVTKKELFKGVDIDELNKKVHQLFKEAGSSSGTLIMKAIPKLSNSQREICYVTALQLFLADGSVQGSEMKLLEDLQEALGIKEARAAELSRSIEN